ncbi:unnamed protein product, partial [Ectocarpus sp. 12 AP-2014]
GTNIPERQDRGSRRKAQGREARTWQGSNATEVQPVGQQHGQLARRRGAQAGRLRQATISGSKHQDTRGAADARSSRWPHGDSVAIWRGLLSLRDLFYCL